MPPALVKSLAQKTDTPVSEVERLWNKAKDLAAGQKHAKDWAYIVGILKKMLGENKLSVTDFYFYLSKKFIESSETNYDKFLIIEMETTMSGDFNTPESILPQKKKDDEETEVQTIGDTATLKESIDGYSYNSTQLNLYDVMSEKYFNFLRLQNLIPDEAIYTDSEIKGKETNPHITVLYGILDNASYFDIKEICKSISPITVTVGSVSLFTNNPDYDVVKVEVISPELEKLHNTLRSQIPNIFQYDYNPHITLAYVEKRSCDFMIGNSDWSGSQYTFDKMAFCFRDNSQAPIQFQGV